MCINNYAQITEHFVIFGYLASNCSVLFLFDFRNVDFPAPVSTGKITEKISTEKKTP